MSIKMFYACLLPIIGVALVLLAGWVRQNGLELPMGCLAVFCTIPFLARME